MSIKYLAATITLLGIGLMAANAVMDRGPDNAMFAWAGWLVIGGSLLEIARRSFWKQPLR